jgi:hypothetical protein
MTFLNFEVYFSDLAGGAQVLRSSPVALGTSWDVFLLAGKDWLVITRNLVRFPVAVHSLAGAVVERRFGAAT